MIRLQDFDRDLRDFSRDYANTVVEFFRDKEPEIAGLLHVNEVHPSSSGNAVQLLTGSVIRKSKTDVCTWSNVELRGDEITIRDWFPEAKAYMYKNFIVLVSYFPNRQYGRSYNRNIVVAKFAAPVFEYYSSNIAVRTSLVTDPTLLNTIYSGKEYSFDEGLDGILSGRTLSFPMFDYFYCILNPYKVNHPVKVFCEDSEIGYVDLQSQDKRIMLYKENAYLVDVFRDNAYNHVGLIGE